MKDKLMKRNNVKKSICYVIDNAPEKIVFQLSCIIMWYYKKYLNKGNFPSDKDKGREIKGER